MYSCVIQYCLIKTWEYICMARKCMLKITQSLIKIRVYMACLHRESPLKRNYDVRGRTRANQNEDSTDPSNNLWTQWTCLNMIFSPVSSIVWLLHQLSMWFFNRRQLRTIPQYGWTPQYYGQFCSLKYSKLYLHSLPDYLYCNNEHLHVMDTSLLRTVGSRIQYFAHSLPLV